jgi:DNA recombination protein RmuC
MGELLWLVGAALVALALVVLLVAIALRQIGRLATDREAAARDAASLAVKFDALAAGAANHERDVRSDLVAARGDAAAAALRLREELAGAGNRLREELAGTGNRLRDETGAASKQLREEVAAALARQQQGLVAQLKAFGERIETATQASEVRLEAMRRTIEERLELLRTDNAQKLDQMRATVDEKLQATLEQRLGASFKQVSERLEQVHRGLGEMQTLATGVGDLKRVLINVKTRGGWGEVQLGALLADLLTPDQYAQNVVTRPGKESGKDHRVEFAIRLPGRDDGGAPCWLPIDAKFPLEDWQRLQDAIEHADAVAVDAARKALDAFFRLQAKTIHEKYVEPPYTTDFAILFVPTESLFAEAVARPGLADALQRDYRITLAGPTNLAAMLNSLQLGFRTLAIEKRSTEVWNVLGAVKTQFGHFGDLLAKTRDKLDDVGRTLDKASRRSTTIARKLRDVETLPELDAERLLPLAGDVLDGDDGNGGEGNGGDEPSRPVPESSGG